MFNPISIAPMMNMTDRFYRYMMRQISQKTLLYTEMITSKALLHSQNSSRLICHPIEHPIALQLGGAEPEDLQRCAHIALSYGYDEINLNVGCPSDRVQSGRFGACLMAEPQLVASCVYAMKKAVSLPVTVKTRIGIDHQDDYASLHHFVRTIIEAGCDKVIVHARKAWLKGLSPKENREIPPLRYEVVYQLKRDFSNIPIIINGGIKTWREANEHLKHVDGVMIGREAYDNPYMFSRVDSDFYQREKAIVNREEIVKNMQEYCHAQFKEGVPLSVLIRPLLGLYQGMNGARQWRRTLSDHKIQNLYGAEIIEQAAKCINL